MIEDSLDGIYDTLKQCARISKSAGGIGLSIHQIRSKGSYIKGTNGHSNGLVPMLRVFNDTARYVDQGGGKRKGSIAIYLEPWHPDIFEFLDLRKNHGKEEMRARDLFYALWTPDLFMERVEANGEWSLFCPNECPDLHDTYGDEFRALYAKFTNLKVVQERPSRLENYGMQSHNRKSRLELHTCSTRMHAMRSLIRRIWEQSGLQTYILRLSSIHRT